jgi:tetratricopeptide (TPR) repeat protein
LEVALIQVIPFIADKEPLYLPLLARGLSDLSALRFNAVEIQAQVNIDLSFQQLETHFTQQISKLKWEGQELWFSGKLNGNQDLAMSLILFDPKLDQLVYQDSFKVPEEKFLEEWELRLQALLKYLNVNINDSDSYRRMYTKSLDAFLAFRKGLETISQAKNDRIRNEGLESLLKAVAYDPEFVEAADILLLFLMQTNVTVNYDSSISILERLHRIATHHPRIPLVLAEIYYQMGNKEKVEQLLRDLVKSSPKFTEGWLRLALFYHNSDRMDDAISALRSILDYEPKEATALDLMGAIYAAAEERTEAEQAWLEALNIDPTRVNILNNLALLAEENGGMEKAELYYQQAFKLNNNWWGSYYNFGSFCFRRNRFEEAVILLNQAIQLNPNHYQAFQNLGLSLIKLGRYNEAQESLLQLLQLAPDNSTRRQTLQLLNQLNDPDVKLELKIRQLDRIWDSGNRWLVIINIGKLFVKARRRWYYWYLLGRIGRDFRIKKVMILLWLYGLRFEPGFPLLKEVGLYYWKKGSYYKALPLLRRAHELHKSDPDTARAYLQTLVNLGEVEELQANIKVLSQFAISGNTPTKVD